MRKKRPNIVFILSDDQGYYSLGCLKNSQLYTPNLDHMVKEGIRFSNFFCASPVCSPARASILTGCIPSCHGVHDWIRAGNINPEEFDFDDSIKERYDYMIEQKAIPYLKDMVTYTDRLKENGYTCALSGKWHLGDSMKPQHGFSYWYTIGKGGCNYKDPDMVEYGQISFPEKYVTDLITDKAVDFIEELSTQENPFYLSVHYTAPHAPWDPQHHPEEYLNLYKDCDYSKYYPLKKEHPNATPWSKQRYHQENVDDNFRGYEASITAMDNGIGKIIQKLKDNGVYDNTIIIFTSDNGFNMGQHGFFGKGNGTYPLNMYEESIRVPFILSYEGLKQKDIVFQNIYSHYDIFPTLLEIGECEAEENEKQPGQSFWSEALKGIEGGQRSTVIFDEYGTTRMIRDERYKYVHRYPKGPHELYDLQLDPHEECNLYHNDKYEHIIRELRGRLIEWFIKYQDQIYDGTKEEVTGLGQLCRSSIYSDLRETFYPWDEQT